MFSPYDISSIYVSGRVFYERYKSHLDNIFDVIFIMHHPLEELAERLVLLSRIKDDAVSVLNTRDNLSLRSAIDFAQSLPFHDEDAFARKLRDIPDGIARVFANPITRQLTCSTPDEMPRKKAVPRALDNMSSFALIGLRRAPLATLNALAEFTGFNGLDLPSLTNLPGVPALAKVLKRTRVVDWLLEQDLELYKHVADAYRKAGL